MTTTSIQVLNDKVIGDTEAYWIGQYKVKGALWIHDGNPIRPHALLTSDNHSNGFFNSRLVIPDEVLLREAATDLLKIFAIYGGGINLIDVVAGPQTGATKLAELLSDQINGYTRGESFFVSPEKSKPDVAKSMIFSDEERDLLLGQTVLLCEDVITTGGSIGLTEKAIIEAGGKVLPFVLALVNRSGLTEVNGKKIIALINRDMPVYEPHDCPICKQGSEAIPAKDPANWVRLNAVY